MIAESTRSGEVVSQGVMHKRYHLLRRQSLKPGPRRSQRGMRKQDSTYDPRGRSLGRRDQASMLANLPHTHTHPIHRHGYAVDNALCASALKCAGIMEPHTSVGCNTL
ncbi:hypothetical protein TNCV_2531631 [Trichonephila clavipes]|nr:hypothetical protein TNCV_2531631 [Trichonephila clavipes]